jgi:hypothetical protein
MLWDLWKRMEATTKEIEIVDDGLVATTDGNVPSANVVTNVWVNMNHCIEYLQEQNDDCIIQEKGTKETVVDVVDVVGIINVGFDVKKKSIQKEELGGQKETKKNGKEGVSC